LFTSPNTTTFIVGQTNTFAVTASGTPTPTITQTAALPAGITFDTTTNTLKGDGTEAIGTYTLSLTASNGVSPDAVQTFTLQVGQAPSITSATTTTFIVGQTNSFTVTATGTPTPTITETATLPAGITFDTSTNTLKGDGTEAAGTYTLSFTATNGLSPDAVGTFTLQVNQAPFFTSANTTTFVGGQTNTFPVTAGGTPKPTIMETVTPLPPGITFDTTTNTLKGDGTEAVGTYTLSFTASNGVAPDAVQSFTLIVGQAPSFTSPNSTTFVVGQKNTFAVTASGTPTPTITQTAALPAGITFDTTTNTLKGDGTEAAGTYTLSFKASNGIAPDATQTFTLQVNQAPSITSADHTIFTLGQKGSFTVTATGTPTPTINQTGQLPTGVSFDQLSNTISGTPTQSGSFTITLTASNGVAPDATQTFTLVVQQAPSITSANNVTFFTGTNSTFTVTTSGFPLPTLSRSGTLPGGIGFTDNGNGTATLSGTATQLGTFPLTFTASNSVSPDAVQNFTLTVLLQQIAPTITSPNKTTFVVGQSNSFQVTASGSPTPMLSESGSLPAGLSFDNKTGILSGTPSAGGTFTFTFTASNGVSPSATQNFTLTINQAPVFTSANNTTFIVGQPANFHVNATGFPLPTVTQSGALPSGINFNQGTSTLTGTPGQPGTYPITFTATNGINPSATQVFLLTVSTPSSGSTASASTAPTTSSVQNQATLLDSGITVFNSALVALQSLVAQFNAVMTSALNSLVTQQAGFLGSLNSGVAGLPRNNPSAAGSLFGSLLTQQTAILQSELTLVQNVLASFSSPPPAIIVASQQLTAQLAAR
jgi:hypothetical protein